MPLSETLAHPSPRSRGNALQGFRHPISQTPNRGRKKKVTVTIGTRGALASGIRKGSRTGELWGGRNSELEGPCPWGLARKNNH